MAATPAHFAPGSVSSKHCSAFARSSSGRAIPVNLCEEKDEVYHCGKAFSLLKPRL
jgi:hypothetical protein